MNSTQADNPEIGLEALNKIIRSVPRLSSAERDELRDILLSKCTVIHKPAGSILIEANQITGCFYICLEGLLRNFYILENGKTFNKSFVAAPSIAGALSEYVAGEASRFSMDCLEDSILLKIQFNILQMGESKPCVQKFYLHIVESLALVKEKREASLLIDDAKTRYLDFCENYQPLVNRISDYHIAAYLGITPVGLSRLKKGILNLG